MSASFSLSNVFADGSKPFTATLAVAAPYTAEQESRVDITENLSQQTFGVDFGSVDDGATVLIIQNATDNQEMFLDLNDNGWTHGLGPGAVFGVISPTLGDAPITEAALVMKTNQGAASSFSTLVLGDP